MVISKDSSAVVKIICLVSKSFFAGTDVKILNSLTVTRGKLPDQMIFTVIKKIDCTEVIRSRKLTIFCQTGSVFDGVLNQIPSVRIIVIGKNSQGYEKHSG